MWIMWIIVNCVIYADPKEIKRQRDREYYAKNKENISKRRRQARELKKKTVDDENTLCHTPSSGQTGVTQVQYTPTRGHVFLPLKLWGSSFIMQNYACNTDFSVLIDL